MRTWTFFIFIFILSGCAQFSNRTTPDSQSKPAIPIKKVSGFRSIKPIQLDQKDSLYFELMGLKVESLTEKQIIQQIRQSYLLNDVRSVGPLVRLLIAKYPKSDQIDSALMTAGNLHLNSKLYGDALGYFNQLIYKYPFSNKTVSAHYAKGILYKKMNLPVQALNQFELVEKNYIGSPEAEKVKIEKSRMRQ